MVQGHNFYPRSPCGERLTGLGVGLYLVTISIHALLAESDVHFDNYNLHCVDISIHALLAESDDRANFTCKIKSDFYPRSPCGERRRHERCKYILIRISIHALLAESDLAPRLADMSAA